MLLSKFLPQPKLNPTVRACIPNLNLFLVDDLVDQHQFLYAVLARRLFRLFRSLCAASLVLLTEDGEGN